MRYNLTIKAVQAFVLKQQLTDTILAEITSLRDQAEASDKIIPTVNARIGQIMGAMMLRPTIIALHKIKKHLVGRITRYPLSDATYQQIVDLLEGIMKAVVGAREAGVKIEKNVEVKF
jgi:hypothetical protein